MLELTVLLKPIAAKIAGSVCAAVLTKQLTDKAQQKQINLCVEGLCHHWDVTGHKIEDTPADFMRENDKLDLLRRIAARMQHAASGLSGNAILAEDLQDEIEHYLSQRWQQSPAEAARIGHAMIEQLRARNFILCFYGISIYGFVHRTFLEYFCATEIKQRFDKRGLVGGINEAELTALFLEHYEDDTWHEILRLICGMVSPQFAMQLIEVILPDRTVAFEQSKPLTLAIQCLAEVADLNEIPETSKRVLDSLYGWFEHKGDREGNRDGSIEGLFEKNALPAVERIGKSWAGREAGVNWLKLTDKRTGTFAGSYCFGRMVAALWSDHAEIEQYLITLSQTQDISMQHMAFDALARCFKESTKALLIEQLMKIQHPSCVWTLTKHYLDHPETYTLLTKCFQNEHSDVRQATVLALAKELGFN
ncbi:MAG: hypothetical protein QX197_16385 [Methylococcaceae bacterium]